MFKRLAQSAVVVIAAVASPSLIAHMVATSSEPEVGAVQFGPDDGWRLTKDGWEQLSPRVIPVHALNSVVETAPPSETADKMVSPPPALIWDLHPAAVTLLIVLGAIAAFSLFPNDRRRETLRRL